MELTTCARPYAKAAFEHARGSASLNEWEQMLTLGANVIDYEKVTNMLSDPQISGRQQADTFIGLCHGSLNREFENFIQVLSVNRRISLLPEIVTLYRQLKAEEDRSQEVTVTSAYPLDQEQQDRMSEKMAARLGRSVLLVVEVDKEILGGAIVKAGDLVIDGSLRARLTKLADAIIS